MKEGSRGLKPVPPTNDPLADFRKCLGKLLKAVLVYYERFENRVEMARLDGSQMLGNASDALENTVNDVKTTVLDGLEARKAQINDVIEQRKMEVAKAVDMGVVTVSKTVDASRTLGRAALETSLGLTADLLKSGRSLTKDLLSVGSQMNQNVYNAGRALTNEISVPNPIALVRAKRNRILQAAARQLRSMASTIEGWSGNE
uniref:Spermine oxidase n=2 Tax=Lygus hesperus TaxID=30085 RepID=A0A0A9XG55_LYGHE